MSENVEEDNILTLDSFKKQGTVTTGSKEHHRVWKEVWMKKSDISDKRKRQESLAIVDLRWRKNRK
jgi:hypothetical protein